MIKKVMLIVIDGMDTVNFTLGNTQVMSGLHGKTAVGVAHTEIFGAGTTITPIAHGMMGTGRNIVAHRPGGQSTGRPFDYYGNPVETIGDIARAAGMLTAAIGKNEASIVLGGTDCLDFRQIEMDGIDATDARMITDRALTLYNEIEKGIIVINYNGVDHAAHRGNLARVIDAVEDADHMVGRIIENINLQEALVIIAADHGTDPITGNHNITPTPLCIITGSIGGRVNLGVVHNIEIAVTATAALGLRQPEQAIGRNLLELIGNNSGNNNSRQFNYRPQMDEQLRIIDSMATARHKFTTSN